MNDYIKYGEAAIKSADAFSSKLLSEINKGVPDSGLRLLKLIEIIPNWETYLTSKQLEVAEHYVKCLSAYEVDYKLNLSLGTTQQRLFGSSTSKGAIGKLEEVLKRLEKQGYFEKQEKIKQNTTVQRKTPTKTITEKTKSEIRELIKLVVEMPDYEKYLKDSQKEKVYQFLRLRSIKQCAKYLNITEASYKQSLLGSNGKGGVLGKLKEVASQKMVNNWDDI